MELNGVTILPCTSMPLLVLRHSHACSVSVMKSTPNTECGEGREMVYFVLKNLIYIYMCVGGRERGTFTKMRKATISFVMSLCPSAWKNLGSHWTDFHEIWY